MSAAGLPITVSRFASRRANIDGAALGAHDHTTWGEFASLTQHRREGEKDGPCFAAATFRVEPVVNLDNIQLDQVEIVRRLKANVTARTLIALDVETSKKTGEVPLPLDEVVEHLARWGKAAVIYTSHNHKPDTDERYRVILPISEPIDPLLPAVEVVAQHLGLLDMLDTSKIGAASLFYLPSAFPGRLEGHEAHALPGDPLVAAALSAAATRFQAARDADAERIAAEAHALAAERRAKKLAAGFDPDDSLIEKLRAHYDLGAVLEAHGYNRAGTKYRHPNSSSGLHGADIKTFGAIERVFSHNATDPLHADNLPGWCGVTALDVVDVVIILAHGGDRQRGLHEMAAKHGLSKEAERKELARLLFRLIRMHANQDSFDATTFEEVLGAAAATHGATLGLTGPEVGQVVTWVAQQAAA
jgi:hypothetical protein